MVNSCFAGLVLNAVTKTVSNTILSISAEDRVGHVTQVSSDSVIIDTTAPTIGHLAVGTMTQEKFVSAQELPVHWDGIEDKESGVKSLEVSIGCLIDKLYVRLSLDARVADCKYLSGSGLFISLFVCIEAVFALTLLVI